MGWDRGRYYTRSKKVGGKVRREYVGTGRVAELAARVDLFNRQQRLRAAMSARVEKRELSALDARIEAAAELAELVARAALRAAGYRQHARGEWRKKREKV